MKIRTLIVSVLGVLLVSSALSAQDIGAPQAQLQEPAFQQSDSAPLAQTEPPSRPQAQQARPRLSRSGRPIVEPVAPTRPSVRPMVPSITQPTTRETPTEVRVFKLRHGDAEEMAKLIQNVFGRGAAYPENSSDSLIVNATKEQMESIASVIEATDIADPKEWTAQDIQGLVYRIYMVEIASGDMGMKPFSMILQVSPELQTTRLLDAARDHELQISGFCLSDERDKDGKAEILVQGEAASNMALKRMVIDDIPESRIKELKWDDAETFTNRIETAQRSQLPEQVEKHIGKFLGGDTRTVGYWFGNLSVPGEVQAPIGPWTMTLQLEVESDHMLGLKVDVEVPPEIRPFEIRLGRERNNEILSNTIRAKVGKPIIIGYSRESYGTRKMGAMVIVPEVDSVQSDTTETGLY